MASKSSLAFTPDSLFYCGKGGARYMVYSARSDLDSILLRFRAIGLEAHTLHPLTLLYYRGRLVR